MMPKRWFLDPCAVTVVLVLHGYPLSAMVATWAGLGDSSTPAITVRVLTLLSLAIVAIRGLRLTLLDGMLVVLWLAYLFRLLHDLNEPKLDGASNALLFFTLTCMLPAAIIAGAQRSWVDGHVVLGLMSTGLLISVASLLAIQYLPGGGDYLAETGRLGFEKLNPIGLGHVACTTVLAALVLLGGETTRRQRFFALAAVPLGLAIVVASGSRGALTALALSFAALILQRGLWHYLIAATLLLLVAATTVDMTAAFDQTRVDQVGLDASSQERQFLLRMAIIQIQEHWMLGSAYTLPYGLSYPHNVMIESWMAMGIFGFLLMVLVTCRGMRAALIALTGDQPMTGLIFLQFLIAAQLSGSLYGWSGLWLGLAVLLAGRRAMRQSATT